MSRALNVAGDHPACVCRRRLQKIELHYNKPSVKCNIKNYIFAQIIKLDIFPPATAVAVPIYDFFKKGQVIRKPAGK